MEPQPDNRTPQDREADKHIFFYSQQDIYHVPEWKTAGFTTEGWYFWDETDSHAYGPYPTRQHARVALYDYCDKML